MVLKKSCFVIRSYGLEGRCGTQNEGCDHFLAQYPLSSIKGPCCQTLFSKITKMRKEKLQLIVDFCGILSFRNKVALNYYYGASH